MSTPQEEGREFERTWASKIGAKPVPGSGNKWYAPLDVGGKGFLWSCKLTRNASFSLKQADLKEAFDATGGPGGSGAIPAMVIRVGSAQYDVVVMRTDDFIALMTEESSFAVSESKADLKRRRAKQPILFREDS